MFLIVIFILTNLCFNGSPYWNVVFYSTSILVLITSMNYIFNIENIKKIDKAQFIDNVNIKRADIIISSLGWFYIVVVDIYCGMINLAIVSGSMLVTLLIGEWKKNS